MELLPQMTLITEEQKQRFKEVGDQTDVENPLVIARLFVPGGYLRWHVVEYYPETQGIYAYVTGAYEEWVAVCIADLENMKLPGTLKVERDKLFKETRFDTLVANNFVIDYSEQNDEPKTLHA